MLLLDATVFLFFSSFQSFFVCFLFYLFFSSYSPSLPPPPPPLPSNMKLSFGSAKRRQETCRFCFSYFFFFHCQTQNGCIRRGEGKNTRKGIYGRIFLFIDDPNRFEVNFWCLLKLSLPVCLCFVLFFSFLFAVVLSGSVLVFFGIFFCYALFIVVGLVEE